MNVFTYAAVLVSVVLGAGALAQDKKKDAKPAGGADEMALMMEMGTPGENHKLLARSVGTWAYSMKYFADPSAPPIESTGVSTVRSVMDGRYFIDEHSGKSPVPGPDGKMIESDFKGFGINGYDNAKKKFISTWMDNMSTGIMMSEGTCDAAKKTFTYHAEFDAVPGKTTKYKQVIKIQDDDHHTFEMFEKRGDKEVRILEIKYARKK